ncbi:MAG: hypothetical protein P8X42_09390 [Calditrichaceae bacterium]|jgi:hypothetical protein
MRLLLKNKYYLLSAITLFLIACSNPFAPELSKGDPDAGLIITAQRSPQEVLTNFSFAYNFKDSLVYSDLLDSSFIFISKNYNTDPVTDINWGRDVDIRTTNRMFNFFQSLDLVWGRSVNESFLDEDSLLYELTTNFQLTIDGGTEYSTITGTALFHFIKKPSGIWKITRWEDRSNI